MALRLKQKSAANQGTWWTWSVWIDGTPSELGEVDSVVYTLHPTFPDPIRTVRDSRTKFRLDETGWGEFEIVASIRKKKGGLVTLKVWLELEGEANDDKPRVFISSSLADAEYAEPLSEHLTKLDIEVLSADSDGANVAASLKSTLGRASGVIVLVSDKPSPWMRLEMETARSLGVPIVPVGLGQASTSMVPHVKVSLPKPADAGLAAKQIVAGLHGRSKVTIFASNSDVDRLISGMLEPRKR